MKLSTSSPSLSPPPPSVSVSKSSTVYPAVHPVPDPTAQACFSSVPLYTAGHKDKIQNQSSTPSSYTDPEKTDHTSSLHSDSSTCNNKTSAALSSACFDENPSPLSDTNCGNGRGSSSSRPASLLHKESCGRMHESEQGRVHRTARETFDDKKLAENDHMKVKMSSCISTACLKTAN